MKLDIISNSTFPSMASGGYQRTLEERREGTCLFRHLGLIVFWIPEEHSHSVFKLISQDKSKPSNKPCTPLWPNSPPCLLSLHFNTSYRFPGCSVLCPDGLILFWKYLGKQLSVQRHLVKANKDSGVHSLASARENSHFLFCGAGEIVYQQPFLCHSAIQLERCQGNALFLSLPPPLLPAVLQGLLLALCSQKTGWWRNT